MEKLIEVNQINNIPAKYRNSPISQLLEYHNLGRTHDCFESAKLLIGTCMDHRIGIRTPEKFAYYIRTGGANMKYSEFNISYVIAIAGIRHFALIGHSQCGMSKLETKKDAIIDGLNSVTNWEKKKAEEHFNTFATKFEVNNEMDTILNETKRLRKVYPNITIAPMLYMVEDNRLYFIEE